MSGTALPPPEELRLLVRELLREVLANAAPARPPHLDPINVPLMGSGALLSHIDREPDSVCVPQSGIGAVARDTYRPTGPAGRSGAREVRLADDADLAAFVAEIARLAADPRRRQDLLTGRMRFTLASTPTSHSGPTAAGAGRAGAEARRAGAGVAATAEARGADAAAGVRRVEKGAVTERTVAAAAKAGERLVLGPKAVLTPLGRDKARALGVTVEKER
jgi:hypothetical protein